MVTNGQADLTAVIRARDEASKVFRGLGGEVQKTNRVFGSFNRALAVVGLTSLSLGFALRELVQANRRTQQATASTTLRLSQLGPEFQRAVEAMRPSFKEIAAQFGFTASEAERTFGILLAESLNAKIGPTELAAAMGLARAAGVDLGVAAKAMGLLLLGDASAARQFATNLGDMNKFMQDSIKEGDRATTQVNLLAGAWRQFFEDVEGFVFPVIAIVAKPPKIGPFPDIKQNLFSLDKEREALNKLFGDSVSLFAQGLEVGFLNFVEGQRILWTEKIPAWVKNFWNVNLKQLDVWANNLDRLWTQTLLTALGNFWRLNIAEAKAWIANVKTFWSVEMPVHVRNLWADMRIAWLTFKADPLSFFTEVIPNGLLNAVKAAINAIPGWVRNLLTGNFLIPGISGSFFPPGLKGFQSGGVVPGPVGRPMMAVVHGGETVTPVGGRRGGTTINITINGTLIDEMAFAKFTRQIERSLTGNARRGVGV